MNAFPLSFFLFLLGVSLMPSVSLPHKVISEQCQKLCNKIHYLVTQLLKNNLLTLSSILTSLYWYASCLEVETRHTENKAFETAVKLPTFPLPHSLPASP